MNDGRLNAEVSAAAAVVAMTGSHVYREIDLGHTSVINQRRSG